VDDVDLIFYSHDVIKLLLNQCRFSICTMLKLSLNIYLKIKCSSIVFGHYLIVCKQEEVKLSILRHNSVIQYDLL